MTVMWKKLKKALSVGSEITLLGLLALIAYQQWPASERAIALLVATVTGFFAGLTGTLAGLRLTGWWIRRKITRAAPQSTRHTLALVLDGMKITLPSVRLSLRVNGAIQEFDIPTRDIIYGLQTRDVEFESDFDELTPTDVAN